MRVPWFGWFVSVCSLFLSACTEGPAPACEAGDSICDGLVPATCSAEGRYVPGAPCPFACSAGSCVGECTPGARRCGAGESTETCGVDATWQTGVACEHVCVGGECAGSCDPGAKECRGSVPVSCDEDGTWSPGAACEHACDAGECVGVCDPGDRRCSGQTPQTCDATGTWQDGPGCADACTGGVCVEVTDGGLAACGASDVRCDGLVPMSCVGGEFVAGAPCPYACGDGACTGECVPGTRRCGADETTETCDATANFVTGTSCEHVCVSGECAGSCDPGAKECREGGAYTCTAAGQWSLAEVCAYTCGAGECAGECVPGTRRCAGLVPEICDASGAWQGATACANACEEGQCVVASCGDGTEDVGEACDDGNNASGDGCSSTCIVEFCGDDLYQPTLGEVCDDGNGVDGDGCDTNCRPTGCGNGVVTSGEACDDGNEVNGDDCDTNCTPPSCGNGVRAPGERCPLVPTWVDVAGYDAEAADIDHDGAVELLVRRSNGLGYYEIEAGALGARTAIGPTTSFGSPYFDVGDVDGDGVLDVVVNEYNADVLQRYLGYGDGTFAPALTLSAPDQPINVRLLDLFEDGVLDLLVESDTNLGNLEVRKGNANGTFDAATPLGIGTHGLGFQYAIADVDGDDHLDLVLPDDGEAVVRIHHGDGQGAFGAEVQIPTGSLLASNVIVIDANGDPYPDLIAGSNPTYVTNAGGQAFRVLLGGAGGSFSVGELVSLDDLDWLAAHDVDADGNEDVLVARDSAHSLDVYFGVGDGTFELPHSVALADTFQTKTIVFIDVSGDGYDDIVCIGAGTQIVAADY